MAFFVEWQDSRGPKGALKGEPADPESVSRWFAVYRPCSSDSIRKMYGKVGVGKGLNVKGKPGRPGKSSGTHRKGYETLEKTWKTW